MPTICFLKIKKKRNDRKRKFHVFAEIFLKNSWNDFKELTLSGFKQKIRQKLIKKFEKSTVYTFPDNSLIYFLNMKRNEMTGNKNYMYLLTFFWRIREMTTGEFIFGGFKQFGTTVQRLPRWHVLRMKWGIDAVKLFIERWQIDIILRAVGRSEKIGFYWYISWESRCNIEIRVWAHFYKILVFL